MYLTLTFVVRIVVQEVGDITLIKDCLYVPKSRKNLILNSSLNKSNYSIYFNKKILLERMIHLFAQVCWLTIFFVLLLFLCYLLLKIIMSYLREQYLKLIRLVYNIYA